MDGDGDTSDSRQLESMVAKPEDLQMLMPRGGKGNGKGHLMIHRAAFGMFNPSTRRELIVGFLEHWYLVRLLVMSMVSMHA